ncbi:MAG: hypothetical protein OXQ29_09520 [Rhodospirillaceae bacterium]|nr:hypothetical protein [Rhodospirillaceae bacterium]
MSKLGPELVPARDAAHGLVEPAGQALLEVVRGVHLGVEQASQQVLQAVVALDGLDGPPELVGALGVAERAGGVEHVEHDGAHRLGRNVGRELPAFDEPLQQRDLFQSGRPLGRALQERLLPRQSLEQGVGENVVDLAGVVDEVLEAPSQGAGAEADEAGYPLLNGRREEAQHDVERDEADGDVEDGMVEHLRTSLRRRPTARPGPRPDSPPPGPSGGTVTVVQDACGPQA